MTDRLAAVEEALIRAAAGLDFASGFKVRGVVRRVGDDVAFAAGLEEVGYEELVALDSGALGLAYELREDGSTGLILLSGAGQVRVGDGVVGLGRPPEMPVGEATLGRILDPLGQPLDEAGRVSAAMHRPLFRPAPELIERKAVDEPLMTGILVLDAAIPIGRGQRELILGDRNVGKTALALDVIAAQRRGDVACVYVAISQPLSRVLAVRDTLSRAGCLDNTVIIAADPSAPPGLQYLAPYAGTTIAEWFRDQGRHALVVYDDLTKHADAYRELALLLDRPPGREAFPGDIFHIHAELLERAAARRASAGAGSVTALPLVETTESDISSYIPTNLISITDGQIYLDTGRFERDQRPAVDVGRSVSRIGAVTQLPAIRASSKNLRIMISRFEALESLTRIGLDVDPATRAAIERGRRLRELLRQDRLSPRSPAEQVAALTGIHEGWLDPVPIDQVRAVVSSLVARARAELPALIATLDAGKQPEEEWRPALKALLPVEGGQPLAVSSQPSAISQGLAESRPLMVEAEADR